MILRNPRRAPRSSHFGSSLLAYQLAYLPIPFCDSRDIDPNSDITQKALVLSAVYQKRELPGIRVRANMAVQDREETRNMRWKAHDTAQLITGLGVRKDLLDLHAGEKMTQEERIKLTALRVGLNPPVLYEDEATGDRGAEPLSKSS